MLIEFYENRPFHIIIDLSYKCNFKCAHCYNQNKVNNAVITKEIIDTTILKIKQSHLPFMISFCGGEPTLEMELLEYGCKKCEENGIKKSIITNLWWHNNQEIINKIENLHLDALQISVDSEHLKNVSVENILNFSKNYNGQIILKTLDNEKQEIKKYFKDFLIIGKQLTSDKDKGCNHNLKYCHLQGLIIDPEGYIRQFCTLSTFHNCICQAYNIKDINLQEFLENEFPELITYRIVGEDTLKYFFIGDLNNLIDKELDTLSFKELTENDIKLDLMNYFREGVVSSWGK